MAHGYSQRFTLKDIFNNKNLAGKLPLVNYEEKVGKDEKVHKTTKMQTVNKLIFETAKRSAKPFYDPFTPSKSGDTIILTGELVADINEPFEAVYAALVEQSQMISFTQNNADMIRSALKESQRVKKETGVEPKLWLRAGSMLEIEHLNKAGIDNLMDDIMRNIFYNDEYQSTQKKYDVRKIPISSTDYEWRKLMWERKTNSL